MSAIYEVFSCSFAVNLYNYIFSHWTKLLSAGRVNNYDTSTANITSLMETIDATRTGYIALSLTEYDSTARPAIAGGSLVEVAGSLFRFSTTEAISTTGVTSTAAQMYYIRLVPTSSQCSAQFSTTASAWREDLQGYYHSTTSNNRVVGEAYFTGVDYTGKIVYESIDLSRQGFVSGSVSGLLLSTVVGAISTVTIPMSGNISHILSIESQGAGLYTDRHSILSYTINSTSVVLSMIHESTVVHAFSTYTRSFFITGVSY